MYQQVAELLQAATVGLYSTSPVTHSAVWSLTTRCPTLHYFQSLASASSARHQLESRRLAETCQQPRQCWWPTAAITLTSSSQSVSKNSVVKFCAQQYVRSISVLHDFHRSLHDFHRSLHDFHRSLLQLQFFQDRHISSVLRPAHCHAVISNAVC